MEKIIEELQAMGLRVRATMPVPHYTDAVRAGIPQEVNDDQEEPTYIPADLAGKTKITVDICGSSMVGFGINDGDSVLMKTQKTAQSGDIVIAQVNNKCTIKAFFEDEFGEKWLVPGNDNYDPIPLSENEDCKIIGIVEEVIRALPRVTTKMCMDSIRRVNRVDRPKYTHKQIGNAIIKAREVMRQRNYEGSRSWFAVYRAFTDRGVVEKGDYSGFYSLLEDIMGEEMPSINIKDIRANMDVLSFRQPVAEWDPDDAPVSGTRFNIYKDIAKATLSALPRR